MPPNGLPPSRLPRSRRVLLLIDFINSFGFPGADKLAGPAVEAARLTAALKERLTREADCTAAESAQAKTASLAYMSSSILKCDTSPSARPAPRKKAGRKEHA